MDTWYHFKDTLLKGESPFNSTYGMSLFDYTAKDVRFNALFNDAMKGHTHIIMNKVMESYLGFHNVDVVVDIGGGLGSTLKMIVERYPHIKVSGSSSDAFGAPRIPSLDRDVDPIGDFLARRIMFPSPERAREVESSL
ncbi:hypothetical protein HPP92_000796 [Vanilla planifolia]|uniref:O-methyltransferase C-terminal domain-containing protein n=1 Tax=Vanilla planifolia TaxID=51239 RepID=A0A835VGF8_VANPL|nr:hypothetical protein HPP92_000796 [Vanilla planifolia]